MTKYALLVGINYTGSQVSLKGCNNDVVFMKDLLIEKLGYSSDCITSMTEKNTPSLQPTGINIMFELYKLVQRCHKQNVTNIFIFYSGHGTHKPDTDGDEEDGNDEYIAPMNYKDSLISDDMIFTCLSFLPKHVIVFNLFNCCNSGSILDLKYRYHNDVYYTVNNKNTPAKIVSISGCHDDDKSKCSKINGVWQGALTYAFIKTIRDNKDQSFCEIIKNIENILYPRFKQKPQLYFSEKGLDFTGF